MNSNNDCGGSRLRRVPAGWRGEILAAARGRRPALGEERGEELAGWRVLFARFPVAWGSLAMLWTALIAVNVLLSGPHGSARGERVVAARPEPLAVWNLQQAELSLLSDGPAVTIRRQPADPARPRSERRRDDETGEFRAEPTNTLTV